MDLLVNLIPGSYLLYSGGYDFDNEIYPFQVNNNFYYLTGIEIPNFVILYNKETNKYHYFFYYKDKVYVIKF